MVLSTDPLAILKNEGYSVEKEELMNFGLQRSNGRLVPLDGADPESSLAWQKGRIEPANGLGIRIGMTKAEVERIAGRPNKRLYSKRFKCDEFVYYRTKYVRDRKGRIEVEEGVKLKLRLANYYLFRNGRVFYIEASQDIIGGG